MCNFFSCNSDGNGNVEFFKVEDIAKIMAEGNLQEYNWNAHTSIANFYGHKGADEDKWNKWEYNPETKKLAVDSLVVRDDRNVVNEKLEEYFKNKDIGFLRNLYNGNAGHGNAGHGNTGYGNTGDGNTGHRNTGHRNTGDGNTGDGNTGHGNTGDNNSGCIIGHFTSQKMFFMFNKSCTQGEAEKVYDLELWRWFRLTEWITEDIMTDKEKEDYPTYKTTQGYLKVRTYKEAWALVPKNVIEEIKALKNFDAKVFEEITGIKI